MTDEVIRLVEELHGFKCPPLLAICTQDHDTFLSTPTKCSHFPSWCVHFSCGYCNRQWNVCKICAPSNKQRTRMTRMVDKIEHNKLHATTPRNCRLTKKRKIITTEDIEEYEAIDTNIASHGVSEDELKKLFVREEHFSFMNNHRK